MEVIVTRGCGLDVHQATVVACLIKGKVRPFKEAHTFSTMTRDLIRMREWLHKEGCTHVAMESTGVYWKPVYNILEGHFELIVANAQHIKRVPGRKTDVKDAEWIADLLRHGLLRPSFVPPPPIRELRDLMRYRRKVVENQSREKNRLLKLLESANIKLSTVVSDVFGASGRLMLEALRLGEAAPREMAELAKGRMRQKLSELELALEGRLLPHHQQLMGVQLKRLAQIEQDLMQLDAEIQVKLVPFAKELSLLDGIVGVDWVVATTLISEIGVDMSAFAGAAQLASWAGLCPGQNESAGKRRSGRIRPGNPYLRSALVEAALAATHEKEAYFREKFYRLKARRGYKRALIAVAHKILIAVYEVLSSKTAYRDLGVGYLDKIEPKRLKRSLVRRLERLGYSVSLTPISA